MELVRYSAVSPEMRGEKAPFTKREKRLFIALAIVLSLNLSVLCGAITFLGLLYGP